MKNRAATVLHITNGDCARDLMLRAGVAEPVLAWADILHEGPLAKSASLSDFSAIRSPFLAHFSGQNEADIQHRLESRDAHFLDHLNNHLPLQLWFEPDLYDQLQLAQIAYEIERSGSRSSVSLIQLEDRYLGSLKLAEMRALIGTERPFSASQLKAASEFWQAVISAQDQALTAIAQSSDFALPLMAESAARWLEERPGAFALNKTQRHLLQTILAGRHSATDIFTAMAAMETYQFLGDLSWLRLVESMLKAPEPLIQLEAGSLSPSLPLKPDLRLELTPKGTQTVQLIAAASAS